MKIDKFNKMIPLYILFIIIFLYCLIMPMLNKDFSNDSIQLKMEQMPNFNEEFTYLFDGNAVNLSTNSKNQDINPDKNLVFSKILYKTEDTNVTLGIRLHHHAVRVYIDGELIYSNGYKEDGTVKKILGNYWVLVPLPADLHEKMLTLESVSLYNGFFVEMPELKYGTRNAVLFEINNIQNANFIISCVAFFIGIIVLLMYLGMGTFNQENRSFLFLGYLTIIISLWLIAESDMLQFFIGNKFFISYLPYFSIILLPIPFVLQLENSYTAHHKSLTPYLYWAFIANATVCILLHVFGIIYIFNTLTVLHILLIAFMIYSIISILYEVIKYKNQEAKLALIEVGIFFVFGAMEGLNYYSEEIKPLGTYLRIGLLVYLARGCLTTFKKLRIGYEKSREAQYFKKLAYLDMLTGGNNRTAYERDLSRFSVHRKTDQSTWLILFDANNLKVVNDNLGHVEGDRFLKYIYDTIVKTFHQYGTTYRTGGDEFACILANTTYELVSTNLLVLQEKIANFTQKHPVGLAVGFAEYNETKFDTLTDFIKDVDNMMYENKRIMKLENPVKD